MCVVNTRSTWIKLLGWLLERSSRRASTIVVGVSCSCEIDMEVGIVVGVVVVGVSVVGSLDFLLLDDQARISAKRRALC